MIYIIWCFLCGIIVCACIYLTGAVILKSWLVGGLWVMMLGCVGCFRFSWRCFVVCGLVSYSKVRFVELLIYVDLLFCGVHKIIELRCFVIGVWVLLFWLWLLYTFWFVFEFIHDELAGDLTVILMWFLCLLAIRIASLTLVSINFCDLLEGLNVSVYCYCVV